MRKLGSGYTSVGGYCIPAAGFDLQDLIQLQDLTCRGSPPTQVHPHLDKPDVLCLSLPSDSTREQRFCSDRMVRGWPQVTCGASTAVRISFSCRERWSNIVGFRREMCIAFIKVSK